jgi:hypothetical protein
LDDSPVRPLLVVIALAVLAPPAAASTATVAGKLEGVPKKSAKAKRATSLRAIRLDTGQLLGAVEPKGTSFSLKLAAGRWVALAANVLDRPGRSYAGLSQALRTKRGKRVRASVRMRRVKAGKASKAAHAQAAGTAAKADFVLGVKRIAVTGLAGGPIEIDGAVTTDVFSKECADGSSKTLVEIRRRQDILDEIKLQNSKLADKSTRIRPHLIDPKQTVEGSGTRENGMLTLELRVVDVKSGKTVARSTASGAETDFLDVLDASTSRLVSDLCGIKADIVFSGSGTYTRDEGPTRDNEHHIRASYAWNTIYRRVDLAGTPTTSGPAFAESSDVSGQWKDDGRFGAEGPGNYSCGGPVRGYNGTFSYTTLEQLDKQVRLTVMPFVSAQIDHENHNCTGLAGAPYQAFQLTGSKPQTEAIVQIDPRRLLKGPIELDVMPTAPVAPDCSDVTEDHEEPCTQALSWSGKLTITRSEAR